jgi:hypothetical protein
MGGRGGGSPARTLLPCPACHPPPLHPVFSPWREAALLRFAGVHHAPIVDPIRVRGCALVWGHARANHRLDWERVHQQSSQRHGCLQGSSSMHLGHPKKTTKISARLSRALTLLFPTFGQIFNN